MTPSAIPPPGILVRHEFRPGDVGRIVERHGTLYARENGFDVTFEAYVAGPLAKFALERTERERFWIAERAPDGAFAGCIAIVATASADEAQLRWFLVDPVSRGTGLGKWLLADALAFTRERGYRSIHLWTVSALPAAAHLYRTAGFARVEEKPGAWGTPVTEERYVLRFG